MECVRTARKALDGAGMHSAPLMVGTGCERHVGEPLTCQLDQHILPFGSLSNVLMPAPHMPSSSFRVSHSPHLAKFQVSFLSIWAPTGLPLWDSFKKYSKAPLCRSLYTHSRGYSKGPS